MDCPFQWDVVMDIVGELLRLVKNYGRHEALPISYYEYSLQFVPYTLSPLERTCKYTQPCAVYRWGQTQFNHSSTLEWLLVGSDGGRVGLLFLLVKETCYDDCHVSLLLFR